MQRAVLHSAGQSWQINSQGENIRIKLRDRIDLWSIALTRPQQRNGTQEPPRTSVFVNEHKTQTCVPRNYSTHCQSNAEINSAIVVLQRIDL